MLLLSVILSGMMVWAQDLPSKDPDFSCTNQATAQQYVRDFNIDTSSFGGMELCNSKVDTKKLFNDLEVIQKGHFNSFGNNVFIRGFIPANNYYSWMKDQTRGIERGQDVPYATAYNRGGYFTMQDGWTQLSTLGRVGTVVHEARHTDGYRHVPCSYGPYQGAYLDGCDTDYDYAGSHAIEMEYYARVSVLGSNFHPVYKTMARLMGIARGNFVFNKPVISEKEGILALNQNGTQADLIVDDQVVQRDVPQVQSAILKRTSFGGAMFDGQKAYAIELYGQHMQENIDDSYSYYKLLTRDKAPIFDFEEFDVAPKRFVLQMTDNQHLQFFNFPEGDWDSPTTLPIQAQRSATRLENGQAGYFLIDNQGLIYPVNTRTHALDQALSLKWDPSLVDVASYNGKTLLLKKDGLIYEKGSNGSESLWSFGKNHYSSMINTPVYNGFTVEK